MAVRDGGFHRDGAASWGRIARVFSTGSRPGSWPVGVGAEPLPPDEALVVGVPTTGQIFPIGYELVIGGGNPQEATPPVVPEDPTFDELVMAEHPTLLAKLNESVGATAATDSSGTGNHGTLSGGVTLSVTGLVSDSADTAADFDGINDRIAFGLGSNLQLQRLTVLALVKVVDGFKLNALDYDALDSGAIQRGYHLGVNAARQPFFFVGAATTSAEVYQVAQGEAITAGVPHMIAGRFDGNNAQLFVDGALVATVARAGLTISYANATGLFAAFFGHGGLPDQYGRGVMARLAVIPYALPDATLLALAEKALGL